jgi:beta-phosphoglucomutase-like phosphatase (HAD superfamily)
MDYFNNIQLNQMLENAHAVIFDMNGLIVDDEKLQLEAVNMTLEPYKIGISEDTWIADFVVDSLSSGAHVLI